MTEDAVRETPVATGPDAVDRTGVQLSAEEQPVRIPSPASARHDAGTVSTRRRR